MLYFKYKINHSKRWLFILFNIWAHSAYDDISWNKLVNRIGLESHQSSEKWNGSGFPSPDRKYNPPPLSFLASHLTLSSSPPEFSRKWWSICYTWFRFYKQPEKVTTKYIMLARIYHPNNFDNKIISQVKKERIHLKVYRMSTRVWNIRTLCCNTFPLKIFWIILHLKKIKVTYSL